MINLGSNPQEIFNKVCVHLDQQGHRAGVDTFSSFQCRYRSTNGDMCAVGCLIPDNQYKSYWEGQDFDFIVKHFKGSYKVLNLVGLLQNAHDRSEDWGKIKGRLIQVGKVSSLNTELVESLPFTYRNS